MSQNTFQFSFRFVSFHYNVIYEPNVLRWSLLTVRSVVSVLPAPSSVESAPYSPVHAASLWVRFNPVRQGLRVLELFVQKASTGGLFKPVAGKSNAIACFVNSSRRYSKGVRR